METEQPKMIVVGEKAHHKCAECGFVASTRRSLHLHIRIVIQTYKAIEEWPIDHAEPFVGVIEDGRAKDVNELCWSQVYSLI